jgi:hypothetical protein
MSTPDGWELQGGGGQPGPHETYQRVRAHGTYLRASMFANFIYIWISLIWSRLTCRICRRFGKHVCQS